MPLTWKGRIIADVLRYNIPWLPSDSSTRSLDHKRQKLTDHSEQVQILRATINSLKEEKFGIESDLQQRIKLEEDKENLLTENATYAQEIKVNIVIPWQWMGNSGLDDLYLFS